MKKALLISFIIAAGLFNVSAQQIKKDVGLLNIGIGLVPGIGANFGYDYGLVDTWGPGIFTVGGLVGINTWSNSYRYTNANGHKYRQTMIAIAPRATYRYVFDNQPFEVYGTVVLGLAINTYNRYYSTFLSFLGGASVGGRYFIDDNFSLFVEVGYTSTVLSAGISFTL